VRNVGERIVQSTMTMPSCYDVLVL
jgi:hypothetical protein